MLRRNFDLIALLIVVAGFMLIQQVPFTGVRMLSAHYRNPETANGCVIGRVMTRLSTFRSQ
jgi:hypothetical protein